MNDEPESPSGVSRYPADFSSPAMHLQMLANVDKYRCFAIALRDLVSNRVVLDIGAGSGILSLISLAYGAKRVIAVERQTVAPITAAVISSFRCSSKELLLVQSDFFSVDHTLISEADVVVSETVGYLGFEENIASIMARAYQLHTYPKPALSPRSLALDLVPICLEEGIDPVPFLSNERHQVVAAVQAEGPRSFTLGVTAPSPRRWNWTFDIERDGEVSGLASFFAAGLTDNTQISNQTSDYWPRCVFPFGLSAHVKEGSRLEVTLTMLPANETFRITLSVFNNEALVYQGTWEAPNIRFNKGASIGFRSELPVAEAVRQVLANLDILSCLERQ